MTNNYADTIYVPNDRKHKPDTLFVLHIHHDGQSGWMGKRDLQKRIAIIRRNKPDAAARLAKMRVYEDSEAVRRAQEVYDAATTSAWKAYDAAGVSIDLNPKSSEAYHQAVEVYNQAVEAYNTTMASARKALLHQLSTLSSESGAEWEARGWTYYQGPTIKY